MLYDKRWDKTKADPFSLENLVAWLEMQPTDEAYVYTDCYACMLTKYFKAMGFSSVKVMPSEFRHKAGSEKIPGVFDEIAQGDEPSELRWTFGAALARAKAALKVQSSLKGG